MSCINHPDREQVAFCQICGRPLCAECVRKVGTAVYCEPDLAAKLGAAPTGAATGAGAVPPVGAVPPSPFDPSAPNPGLAALLGFIPGVGAMYNGQFAKGLIHLAVFAILCSLAGDHGIFMLFVFGWVFYQVIEAYQTAVAKREGKPLPNPLGLNDIGARFGSQRSWGAPVPPPVAPSASAAQQAYSVPVEPAASANPYNYSAPYSYPPVPPAPPTAEYPPVPPVPPDGMFGANIPVGAVWLIVLGIIFLLGMARPFSFIRAGLLIPVFLIAWGVWWYIRTYHQSLIYSEGSGVTHSYLQFQALRRSGWMVVIGVLWLLAATGVLHWGASWPLILIFIGLITIGDRFFTQQVADAYTPVPPVVTPPPASTPTSIFQANDSAQNPERNEEGR